MEWKHVQISQKSPIKIANSMEMRDEATQNRKGRKMGVTRYGGKGRGRLKPI